MERAVPQECVKLQGLNLQMLLLVHKCHLLMVEGLRNLEVFPHTLNSRVIPRAGLGQAALKTSLLPHSEGSGTWEVLPHTAWWAVGKTTGNSWTFFKISHSQFPLVFCLICSLQNKTTIWHIFLGALLLLVPVSARGERQQSAFSNLLGCDSTLLQHWVLAATGSWQCVSMCWNVGFNVL